MAAEKALEVLNKIAEPIAEKDTAMLEMIAMTAMTGKGAEKAKEQLSKLAVKAVRDVADLKDGKLSVNKDNIKIEKKVGGAIEDSELVEGIILDKEKVHPGMAYLVK